MENFIKETVSIKINDLEAADFNPNDMGNTKFNKLVERIKEQGFKDPISVVPLEGGKYRIIEGEHRWKAADFLQFTEVPCFIHENWDEDKQRFEIVKSNVLKGKMDVMAFTNLVNGLSDKYSKDIIQDMMGFQDEREFETFYKTVRKQLPEDMQKKLDESKKEIRTIDDLSVVLNKIFFDYKDDLAYGFMVFSYNQKQVYWIDMDKDLKKLLDEMAEKCRADNLSMSEMIKMALFGEEIKTGNE